MFKKVKQTIQFLKDVASDERIPSRDKKVLLALIALVISPIDFIPDWIPILGQLDDLIMIALILDYFFEYLDQDILLYHYPFRLKGFARFRWYARLLAKLAPKSFRNHVWKYKPSLYGKK